MLKTVSRQTSETTNQVWLNLCIEFLDPGIMSATLLFFRSQCLNLHGRRGREAAWTRTRLNRSFRSRAAAPGAPATCFRATKLIDWNIHHRNQPRSRTQRSPPLGWGAESETPTNGSAISEVGSTRSPIWTGSKVKIAVRKSSKWSIRLRHDWHLSELLCP